MSSSFPAGIKLGTTLYSFSNEYHAREYSFEELVRKVAREGLGPGLEVVGFQSFRDFPRLSDETVESFKALIDETGLVRSCLGINADVYNRPGQAMSDDESLAYHVGQVEAAARLGFPLVRYQFLAGPRVIERLVPTAERLGVKLGLEIHAPHHPNHPHVLEYREMYERSNSPFLGFIPDFGASARAVPPSFFEAQIKNGVPQDLISLAKDYWARGGEQLVRQNTFIAAARERGFVDRHIMYLVIIFGLFSPIDPKHWLEIMPQVIHIHGKFFDFGANGEELAVDYPEILPIFAKAGYDGFMSSEYEGHMWSDSDAFDKVRKHQALAKRVLASIAA